MSAAYCEPPRVRTTTLGKCYRLRFFFQAEDGIRDVAVTGVQTCALPISARRPGAAPVGPHRARRGPGREACLLAVDASPLRAGAVRRGGLRHIAGGDLLERRRRAAVRAPTVASGGARRGWAALPPSRPGRSAGRAA